MDTYFLSIQHEAFMHLAAHN